MWNAVLDDNKEKIEKARMKLENAINESGSLQESYSDSIKLDKLIEEYIEMHENQMMVNKKSKIFK